MPFVIRDREGNITDVFDEATAEATEELAADDPELLDFEARLIPEQDVKQRQLDSDAEMTRVLEDLIELLIENNTIMLTDLPERARQKIMRRRQLRQRMGELIGLIDEDDVL